jgi:hypothetical protein
MENKAKQPSFTLWNNIIGLVKRYISTNYKALSGSLSLLVALSENNLEGCYIFLSSKIMVISENLVIFASDYGL